MQVQLNQSIKEAPQKANKKTKALVEAFGIEAAIVFSIVCVILVVLNYFSILPLSQKFPDIFGFFPVKNGHNTAQNMGNTTSLNKDLPLPGPDFIASTEYLFSCPIPKFCPDIKQVYDKDARMNKGQGYIYADQKISVQAIIDGTILSSEEKDGIVTIVEESADKSFKITYKFSGKLASKENADTPGVKNYGLLGTVEGGPHELSPYTVQKYYMYFEIVDLRTGKYISVKSVENGNGLDFL